jgi:hypothetical protein
MLCALRPEDDISILSVTPDNHIEGTSRAYRLVICSRKETNLNL